MVDTVRSSAKTGYGIRIPLGLAVDGNGQPATSGEMAQHQSLLRKRLEHVLASIRSAEPIMKWAVS